MRRRPVVGFEGMASFVLIALVVQQFFNKNQKGMVSTPRWCGVNSALRTYIWHNSFTCSVRSGYTVV